MTDAIQRWHALADLYTIKHTCDELGIVRGQQAVWGPTGKPCTFYARCDRHEDGERWYSFFTQECRTMEHASHVYWVWVDPVHGQGVLHAEP